MAVVLTYKISFSPEALIVQVLSPCKFNWSKINTNKFSALIVPRVLSPEAGALLILSPAILSPRILSGHTLTVEVSWKQFSARMQELWVDC